MKQEFDSKLCLDFPEIFSDRWNDPQTTMMCWGFECGDGWFNLIHDLCTDIMIYCVGHGVRVPKAVQVKEKFGGLRFYVDEADDVIYSMISLYEKKSYKTCEVCGDHGVVRQGGWVQTLCDRHFTGEESVPNVY